LAIDADAETHAQDQFGKVASAEVWNSYRHTFSHYHLDITPVLIQLAKTPRAVASGGSHWYSLHEPEALGLAAPVKKLLEKLSQLDPRR
jgi:A/G-specific adenine glycosylase